MSKHDDRPKSGGNMKLQVIHDLPAFVLVPETPEDCEALGVLLGDHTGPISPCYSTITRDPVEVSACRVDYYDFKTEKVDRRSLKPHPSDLRSMPVAICIR